MSKVDGGLRALFSAQIAAWGGHPQAIEVGAVGRGVPDLNYALDGVEGWIEFKSINGGNLVGLRPEQVAWINRRTRSRGRVHIAVRRADALLIYPGAAVEALHRAGIKGADPTYRAEGGPAAWGWGEIRRVLTATA